MSNSSALLIHVLSQTKDNLDFLVSQGQLSSHEVGHITSKLSDTLLAAKARGLEVTPQSAIKSPQFNANSSSFTNNANSPSIPSQTTFQAKAIWGYNEEGSERDDLSFQAGNVIEVLSTMNPDWWTGRYNGREGIFPSNYVERLEGAYRPPPPPPSSRIYNSGKVSGGPSHFPVIPAYQPPSFPPPNQYSAPQPYYGGVQHPPPIQGSVPYPSYNNNVPQPPLQVPPSAPTEQPQEPKKSKFGGLGNTLAHSAAGGVGFGAGSAVGSGIINSIF
ncbi:hypothetical protein BDQ17DRAFT_1281814 [Cyathus striatus]|nr:hypothetical protein BDQ17DRAFT_1281814 [Cyathus striatus]